MIARMVSLIYIEVRANWSGFNLEILILSKMPFVPILERIHLFCCLAYGDHHGDNGLSVNAGLDTGLDLVQSGGGARSHHLDGGKHASADFAYCAYGA